MNPKRNPMMIRFEPINSPIPQPAPITEPTVLVKWFARALWRAPVGGGYANRMMDACRSGAAWAILVRSVLVGNGLQVSPGLGPKSCTRTNETSPYIFIYIYTL